MTLTRLNFFAATSWACEIICLMSYEDQIHLAWNFRGVREQLGHTLFRNRVKIKQVWICSATVGCNIWVTSLLWRDLCHNLRVNKGLFSVSVWEVTFSFPLKKCAYLHMQKSPKPNPQKIRQNKTKNPPNPQQIIKAKTLIYCHACKNPSSQWSYSAAPAITKPAEVSLCRFPEWGLYQHLSMLLTHFSPLLVWNLHQSSWAWIVDSEGWYSAFILSFLLCQEPQWELRWAGTSSAPNNNPPWAGRPWDCSNKPTGFPLQKNKQGTM